MITQNQLLRQNVTLEKRQNLILHIYGNNLEK